LIVVHVYAACILANKLALASIHACSALDSVDILHEYTTKLDAFIKLIQASPFTLYFPQSN